jgi:hypothetical protein
MKLQTRKLAVSGPQTVNVEARSVAAIAASEKPVKVFSWERGIINEVILIDGVEFQGDARQVPLLDAHSRHSQRSVLGSARSFNVKGGELHCEVWFSSTSDGDEAFTKVREGHLTDFSIGYVVLESVWIPEGEKQTIRGKTFEGPLQVATKTLIRELSLVPIGADSSAKARAEHEEREASMDKTLEEIRAEAVRAEQSRICEIKAMCEHFNCPDADMLIRGNNTLEEARKHVMSFVVRNMPTGYGFSPTNLDEYSSRNSIGGRIGIGRDASEKRRDAVIDGFVLRSGIQLEKPAPGANEYAVCSFLDLARECLTAAGENVRGLTPNQVMRMALGQRAMVTADFPSILAAVSGKVLRMAYEQVPDTWRPWCKIGSSKDFKEQMRPILSEMSDLDEVPEGTRYPHGETLDGKEVFSLATYGKIWSVTRQALINDDLGALTDIPRAWGASAKRKITSLVYGILTGNPEMSDGVPLFDALHDNVGTVGVISKTALTEARKLMRTQKGPQGLAVLNVKPRFLIVPAALETTAEEILSSISLDELNSGIANPFRGKFEIVCEPTLDVTDAARWFMAADPASIDTVEVSFLNGEEGPYIESREGWNVDGMEVKCRLDVGVKALDWRGLFKNNGE